MIIGIVANTTKDKIEDVVSNLIRKVIDHNFDYYVADALQPLLENSDSSSFDKFLSYEHLARASDILLSVGGDGTMLSTSIIARQNDKPVIGVNFGKLGFLTEIDISAIDECLDDLSNNRYTIEERMILEGTCKRSSTETLFAVNDIVIEKGGWAKMIEIGVTVEGEYVTTFSADGIIISTPTGSTGYSLSVGGPIVSPRTDVITLSPISAHSLTVRPLVLPGDDVIQISVESHHNRIQIHSDGQRTIETNSPIELSIRKSKTPLKLIRTHSSSYFEILRNKLLWGIDIRKFSNGK